MQLVYNYDKDTKEFIGANTAFLDKVATRKAGVNKYLLPSYATFIAPPKTEIGEVAIFDMEKEKWNVVKDYRGRMVFNIETRQGVIWDKLGAIPAGYTTELKPSLSELKAKYLSTLKINFNKYLKETKITIPKLELVFTYGSLNDLIAEKDMNLAVSRDVNNMIYTGLTNEQYCYIIDYLTTFGQIAYLNKWSVENIINKCEDVDLLRTYKNKLEVKVDIKHLDNLMKLDEEKRKDYFIRNANNIK